YKGAYMHDDQKYLWIIKPVNDEEIHQARLGMYVYFLNHFTGSISAPSIVTEIDGQLYKASKIIPRTEQLSGAPYQENRHLSSQLALDLINSWIYYDEDRNPNNYLIYYNTHNIPVVVAIDFSNVDLLTKDIKIKGREDTFGWERLEKTRYMTPLKNEQFFEYSYEFYSTRLNAYKKLNKTTLNKIGNAIFAKDENCKTITAQLTTNILQRIEYVDNYFQSWFNDPEKLRTLQKRTKKEMKDEYRLMGRFFNEQLNQ
ncbi:MAG: hypothetical protein D6B26_01565, partial [Spirochaetaceae bacterium]